MSGKIPSGSLNTSQKFEHLDKNVHIIDHFYQDPSTYSLRPILTDESSLYMQSRKSIVNETKSLQELEEHLSLQDLKTLKQIFQTTIRNKLEKINNSFHYDITEKDRSLNKQEFIEAFSNIDILQEYNEYEFEILFDKLDMKEVGFINWSDFCNQLIVKYNENECTQENLNFIPFLNKMKIKFSAHNRRDESVKMLTMENPWRFINVSRVTYKNYLEWLRLKFIFV